MYSSQVLLPGMRALSRYHIEFKRATLEQLGIIAWRAPWGRAPVVAFSKQMHSVRPYDSCVVGYNSLADFDSNYLMFLTGSMSDVYFWYYQINTDYVLFNYNGCQFSVCLYVYDIVH